MVTRPVLQLFTRSARIMQLTVQGVAIQTTGEHPFFVLGHGWLPANELQPGDFLATRTDAWVRVDTVDATEVWGTVHNLEVAEDHTYFVGCDEWGFSVWAHNADYGGTEYFPGNLKALGFQKNQIDVAMRALKRGGEPDLHRYLTEVRKMSVDDANAAITRLKANPYDTPPANNPFMQLEPAELARQVQALNPQYGHLETPASAVGKALFPDCRQPLEVSPFRRH